MENTKLTQDWREYFPFPSPNGLKSTNPLAKESILIKGPTGEYLPRNAPSETPIRNQKMRFAANLTNQSGRPCLEPGLWVERFYGAQNG